MKWHSQASQLGFREKPRFRGDFFRESDATINFSNIRGFPLILTLEDFRS